MSDKKFIQDIKTLSTLKGSYEKKPTPGEITTDHIHSFRRAIYPVRDLKAGTIIQEEHLVTLRPNHGIDARDYDELIGKTINQDVEAFMILQRSYFK